ERQGGAGLSVDSRAKEAGIANMGIDSATLITDLDAQVILQGGTSVVGQVVSLLAFQNQHTDAFMDAGTIALVKGRSGNLDVQIGGTAQVTVQDGAQVEGTVVNLRARQEITGESELRTFSVSAVGVGVSTQTTTMQAKSL